MIETDLEQTDVRKLLSRGRDHIQDYYSRIHFCKQCKGHGSYWGSRPNRNVPGKSFPRLKSCGPCKGKGYIEEWSPETILFYCTSPLCRYVTYMDIRDVIKGLKGLVRSHSVDRINYTTTRECPRCGTLLKAAKKTRFWRWSTKDGRWVNYWKRRPITIRRI